MDKKIQNLTIWQKLQALNVTINTPIEPDYLEYIRGIKIQDESGVDKIYNFIESAERGVGIPYDEDLINLVKECYKNDPQKTFAILVTKDSFITIWVILSTACNFEMLSFFTKECSDNYLFCYECTRIIFQKYDIDNAVKNAIIDGIRNFGNGNIKLWVRWIKKYEWNNKWINLLDNIIVELDLKLLRTYIENINLSIPVWNMHIKTIGENYKSILHLKNEEKFKVMAELLINRWEDFLKNKKFSIVNLHITPYTTLIMTSMDYIFSENHKLWIDNMIKWVEILDTDMYNWYKTEYGRKQAFYCDMTQIYYLIKVVPAGMKLRDNTVLRDICTNISYILEKYDYFEETNNLTYKEEIVKFLKLCKEKHLDI